MTDPLLYNCQGSVDLTRRRTKRDIKREFQKGELNYLDAIEALQEFLQFSSLEAEALVGEWQDCNGAVGKPNLTDLKP